MKKLLPLVGLLALAALGCNEPAPEPPPPSSSSSPSSSPLTLETVSVDGTTHLKLVAAPGVRINARLKPALELADGRVIRFDSPSLSRDSSYFETPPTAELSDLAADIRGTLRASICDEAADFCRTVKIAQ